MKTHLFVSEVSTEIAALHDAAMEAEDRGDHAAALDMERRAALAVTVQPDRAILLRSAATIALAMGDHAEALRLARLGLSDEGVPGRYRAELEDVARDAKLAREDFLKTIDILVGRHASVDPATFIVERTSGKPDARVVVLAWDEVHARAMRDLPRVRGKVGAAQLRIMSAASARLGDFMGRDLTAALVCPGALLGWPGDVVDDLLEEMSIRVHLTGLRRKRVAAETAGGAS